MHPQKVVILHFDKQFVMKQIGFLLLLLMVVFSAEAQNKGELKLNQDAKIETLIEKQHQIYSIDSSFSGYRIHIFMEIGNHALKHAEEVKKRFESEFPDIPIYLTYAEPNFRLRAGNFRNRVEAEKCLRRIKPKFREAFVTSDIIYQPKIELKNKTEED